MMVMGNKQDLSNIWIWIYEKNKQHWGWVEKRVAYKKKRLYIKMLSANQIAGFLNQLLLQNK